MAKDIEVIKAELLEVVTGNNSNLMRRLSGLVFDLSDYVSTLVPKEIIFALNFNSSKNQYTEIPTFTPIVGFEFSFKSTWGAEVGDYYFGNDSTKFNKGAFLIQQTDLNTVKFFAKGSRAAQSVTVTNLIYGDKLGMKYTGTTQWECYKNDVLVGTINASGFIAKNKALIFGGRVNGATQTDTSDCKIWDITVDAETWSLDEQLGTIATGSNGTIMTLEPNLGVVADMWGTSAKFTSTNSFIFDYRAGDFEISRKYSYYRGKSIETRMVVNSDDAWLSQSNVARHAGFRIDNHQVGKFEDTAAPIYLNQNIGGIHGWKAEKFTVAGHGKTIANDIYSVWSNGGIQYLLWNIDGTDTLYMAQRNIDNGLGIPAGTYAHVSGATNTADIIIPASSVSANMQPSIKRVSKELFIDGVAKNVANNALYDCNSDVRVKEVYEIIEEQSIKDYLVTLQGGGVIATNGSGTSSVKITNEYRMDETEFIFSKMAIDTLTAIPVFDHTKFLQQTTLAGVGDDWYIPKSAPITTADGTFNLSNLTPYQVLTANLNMDSATYEDATSPQDRQLLILNGDNSVYIQGFLPTDTAAIGTRINNVNLSCQISSVDQKLYMRGQTADRIGTSLASDENYTVYSYRGVIAKEPGRTASYFIHNYDSNKGYMVADWHTLPVTDVIDIPLKYQGKSFTVIEKESNVTMAAGTLGSTLSVPVDATKNYGFLVIEINI